MSFKCNEDTFWFSLVASLINVTYKLLLFTFRFFCEYSPDRWAAPLSAFIAGFWIKLDPSKNRVNWLIVLTMSKALDVLINMKLQNAYKVYKKDEINHQNLG